jgi:hypothetical protein
LLAHVGLPLTTLTGMAIFTFCYLPLATSRDEAARHRLALTLVFGLIHGLGFASVLMEVGLPASRLAGALFAFNVGVEAGQLAIVAVLGGLAAAGDLYLRPAQRRWFADASSAALFGLGVYWFVGRAFPL